tara:strand:- start:9164 stop:9403 length:240 start_codon:yes stop_codon:yes gene_type:complete
MNKFRLTTVSCYFENREFVVVFDALKLTTTNVFFAKGARNPRWQASRKQSSVMPLNLHNNGLFSFSPNPSAKPLHRTIP